MASEKLPSSLPRFFWHFVRQQWLGFLILLICFLMWPISETASPYFIKRIIDAVTTAGHNRNEITNLLTPVIIQLVILWVLVEVAFRTYDYLYASIYPVFRARVRMEMVDYAKLHSSRYFADNFAGSIASKINQLPISMEYIMFFFTAIFIPVMVAFAISFFMLWRIDHDFTYILLGWFLLHMGLNYIGAHVIAKYSEAHAESLTKLNGKIVDGFTNIMNIKLFAREGFERRYLQKYQDIEVRKSRATMIYTFRFKAVLGFISMVTTLAWWLAAIWSWYEKRIGLGDLALILGLLRGIGGLAWYFGEQLTYFFDHIGNCRQALTLVNRVHEVQDNPGAKPLLVTHGEITFEKVKFSYSPRRHIFTDKTLTINPGEKTGLVGFSGSGKTTFVNLILRFYDIEGGRITIDGQDIAEVTQESLRAQIAMIPQDATLFHRTLMENIRYGRPEASDTEIIAASKQAHCHEFITELKDGYDSLVGERGVKLSGGQRQRIAVARAILKNAPILILDEATSSLDSITEKYIQESLDKLIRGRTTIVIAHRLSTLIGMDRILVFDRGKIIEDGVHGALIAKKGHYQKLWNMQAGGFLPDSPI